MKFMIYADGELVGWSEFPTGDPPMGVAQGPFYPEPGYEKIRPVVLERREYDIRNDHSPESEAFYKDWFERFYEHDFTVVAEDGGSLDHQGILFTDFGDLLPIDEEPYPYEVSVIGIPAEEYRQYFQARWDAYDALFGS